MNICRSSKVLIVAISLFSHSFISYSGVVKDTVIEKTNSSMQEDYTTLLSKGYLLIKSNQFEDGVKYLCMGFKQKTQLEKDDRIEDFQMHEFIDLLKVMNAKQLKKEELEQGYQFVKEVATNKYTDGQSNLDKFLKKNPKSVFCLRLKFMYLIDNPSRVLLYTYTSKLLDVDSTIVAANIFKGRILAFEGKLAESLLYFSRAIRYSPEYSLAYYLRAVSLDELHDFQKAIEDYSKAIDLYPNYFDAYNNRGNARSTLKIYKEAIADFRKAMEIKPESDWPYLNIALVYRAQNELDSALQYIQEALDINPRSALALNSKAEICMAKQDFGSAVNAYTKSINLEPKRVLSYLGRGDAYFFDNKDDQAMPDYQKALELDKKNSYVLMRVGDCYYRQKDYTNAITYYEESQKLNPNNLYLLVTKGLCFNQMGRNKDAKESLLKAVALDSTSSIALGNLGWVYYCLGDFEKCISFSHRAIRYQNDAYYAMFNIALSTLRLGKYEESVELYKKYIASTKAQDNLSGAMTDLKDLIKQNILVKESKYILDNLFQARE